MSLTGAVFLLCFLGGLGLAFVRHPIYGLYTYVAVFYLDAHNRWWGQDLPDLRWGLLAAVVTAVAMFRIKPNPYRKPWYRTFPAMFLFAYTAWLWIQTPWALDPQMHRECSIIFTKFIIVYYIVYRLVDTPKLTADFLLANLLGCFYLGIVALGTPLSGGRLDGVGGSGIDDSNTLGMHAGAIAVAGSMLVLAMTGWRRYVAIVAILFTLNMVVLTGSRGAFLALVLGGLTLFVLRPREKTRVFYAYAVLGVMAFLYVAPDSFWERMQTIESAAKRDENMDNSAEGRFEQMKAGLVMFSDYPIGVGHRGFPILSPAYLAEEHLESKSGQRASHNTFISALVEQGFIGGILFASMILWVLASCLLARVWAKRRRPLLETSIVAAVCGGLIVVIVGGMFADFLKVEVQVWLLSLLSSLKGMPVSVPTSIPTHAMPDPHAPGFAGMRRDVGHRYGNGP